MEIRNNRPVRVEKRDDGPGKLVGYAGVYYVKGDPTTEFEHPAGFTERFVPGVFDDVEGRDIKAGYNHSLDRVPLGRTPNTLRLSVDNVGLRYEIDLPDTQSGHEMAVAVDRGDVRGSSLEFIPAEGGEKRFREDGRAIREIRRAVLYQVGPVDNPAYEGTSVILRSEDQAAYEQWIEDEKAQEAAKSASEERNRKLREMVLTGKAG